MPVHNCEKTLVRSLSSLADQTYRDFETIFVDNNSTDRSIEIAKDFKETANIKFVECKIKGIVPTLNTGVAAAQGNWIARQDGDDYWYPTKLEKQMKFLEENPDVSILGTRLRLLSPDGDVEEIGTFGLPVKYPTGDQSIKTGLLHGQNMLCHPSVVVAKRVFLECGGYENIFPMAEDLHLWMKAIPFFKFANLEEVLIDYTQTKSENYDARIPLLCADMYWHLYKIAGLVEGERENLIYNWQTEQNGHRHGAQ